jgi:hypothetical protein
MIDDDNFIWKISSGEARMETEMSKVESAAEMLTILSSPVQASDSDDDR